MENKVVLENMQEISALREGLKHAHKRIDENEALTAKIHELTTAIQTLAIQLKNQNDRMDQMINTFEKRMTDLSRRIGELEKKPARRWEAAVSQIITILIAAAMGWFVSRLGM